MRSSSAITSSITPRWSLRTSGQGRKGDLPPESPPPHSARQRRRLAAVRDFTIFLARLKIRSARNAHSLCSRSSAQTLRAAIQFANANSANSRTGISEFYQKSFEGGERTDLCVVIYELYSRHPILVCTLSSRRVFSCFALTKTRVKGCALGIAGATFPRRDHEINV